LRPVRRSFYDPSSAPGHGWIWEWENDAGSWTTYDTEVGIAIQAAHEWQQPWLDLAPLGFCYLIDFQSMTQINHQTQRRRRIQCRSDLAYPLVSGPLPKLTKSSFGTVGVSPGQSCACQQCMLVLSVKTNAMAASHTLGRKPLQTKPSLSPKGTTATTTSTSSQLTTNSYSRTLPLKLSSGHACSSSKNDASFSHSLSLLTSRAANIYLSSRRPPPTNTPFFTAFHLNRVCAFRVPTVPVKNLSGSSPVHPALAGITGILMSAAGLPVCLTRPPKLVLHPPTVSKSDIKPIPGLGHCCRKTTKKQTRKGGCPNVADLSRSESVGRLAQCGHQYHLQCLVAMYLNGIKDGSLQCPTCKTIYGVKTGNQPPGKMEYHIIPYSLPGHPDCKTIRIIYNIPPGIQGPEHPNPGKPFTARGFPRHCYLPDSEKGRKVLRLLIVAWDRRLVFSVGTSSTTGETDTVIWNEVHHKTEFGSNLTGHGYPDPGHLDNVLDELKAQGITEEDGQL
uniref:E3 ubiquitin-protein ligase n=1 Tax=Denticeps clupeoides TaxID=299321 RepID=A0AAY4A663_9TELE